MPRYSKWDESELPLSGNYQRHQWEDETSVQPTLHGLPGFPVEHGGSSKLPAAFLERKPHAWPQGRLCDRKPGGTREGCGTRFHDDLEIHFQRLDPSVLVVFLLVLILVILVVVVILI
jgi:hypothetical protein